MNKNKPTTQFWRVLAIGNILAMIYPVSLLLRADGSDDNLFAIVALIGSVFLLMVVDAISVVVADVIGNTRQ